MSKKLLTHYASETEGAHVFAACRTLATFWTRDRDAVTCRSCLAELVALGGVASLEVSAPWTPPPPRPATQGTKYLTPYAIRTIAESRSGTRSGARFGSLDAALKLYAGVLVDGYPSGSASGGTEQLGAMGCMIQTGGGGSSKTTRLAEDVAEVAGCVGYVAGRWPAAHPHSVLTPKQVSGLWLLMEVGKPLAERAKRKAGKRDFTPKEDQRAWSPMKPVAVAEESGVNVNEVRALRRWCRQGVVVELVSRGLMRQRAIPQAKESPENAARKAREWEAENESIEARKREIGRWNGD